MTVGRIKRVVTFEDVDMGLKKFGEPAESVTALVEKFQAEEGLSFTAALEKVRDRHAALWEAYLFR